MKDKIDGLVLQQWVIDFFKLELKLFSYFNDFMCEREDFFVGIQNWNVKGEKVVFFYYYWIDIYIRKKILYGCV